MFVNERVVLISNGKALALLMPENKGVVVPQFRITKYQEAASMDATRWALLTFRSRGVVQFLHSHQACCDAVFGKPPTLNEVLTMLHSRISS